MEVISRAEARALGRVRYYTGKPCKYGHIAPRYTADWKCAECAKIESQRYYQKNREKCVVAARKKYRNNAEERKAYSRQYVKENREKVSKARRDYRERNSDKIREYNQEWREENKEHRKAYMQQWRENNPNRTHEYYKENRDYYYEKLAQRRASKLQRTLPNHDDELAKIYSQAADIRKNGHDVHVDHIVPLQGETVSGLHVPWNLQIISAQENISKGNRFVPYVEFSNSLPLLLRRDAIGICN